MYIRYFNKLKILIIFLIIGIQLCLFYFYIKLCVNGVIVHSFFKKRTYNISLIKVCSIQSGTSNRTWRLVDNKAALANL